MNSPPRIVALGLGFVLVVALSLAMLVGASSGYELTVDDGISTPTQSVEIDGDEYDIEGVGVVTPGDQISITVTSAEDYRIFLYNQDGQSEFNAGWSADEEHITIGTADDDLDTAELAPGTYLLSLEPRGEGRQAVYPVVVEGYDLELSFPNEIDSSSALEVTATVERTALDEEPADVSVAIWDGDDVTELTLDRDGEGSYSTVLEAGSLESGTYDVYGGISSDSSDGHHSALAVTNGGTLTVFTDSDDSDDAGDHDDADSDDSDDAADEREGDDSDDSGESDSGASDDGDTDGAADDSDSDDSGGDDDHTDHDGDSDDGSSDEGSEDGDTDGESDDETEPTDDDAPVTESDDDDEERDGDADDRTVIDRNESTGDDGTDDDGLGNSWLLIGGSLFALLFVARLLGSPSTES
ncbi:hypothetical protein [Natronosalvus vescus]|uniref:hypothetical protein n=1 Tax=Natronosalvus vescus TaxID=2953881 RepID=UPI002091A241|nr:hypothetical protein [Natronosalvus vescus]